MRNFFLFLLFVFIPISLFGQELNHWETKSSDGFIPRGGLLSCAYNGKIYIFGGGNNKAPFIGYNNYLQIYDPPTDTWITVKVLGHIHFGSTANLIGDKMYIIRGDELDTAVAIDIFDPLT